MQPSAPLQKLTNTDNLTVYVVLSLLCVAAGSEGSPQARSPLNDRRDAVVGRAGIVPGPGSCRICAGKN